MTKVERKALLEERKRMLKTAWSSASDDSNEEANTNMPDGLKKFTIEDRKIILQKPVRQKPETPGVSYDGPQDSKQVNLAEPGEEPRRMVCIATDLSPDEEELLVKTLREYKEVFAWSYKDLKGVDAEICQHTIPLRDDAKPSKQRPYTYNDNFGNKIKQAFGS